VGEAKVFIEVKVVDAAKVKAVCRFDCKSWMNE